MSDSEMIECATCGALFDPADLAQVFLHEHTGLTERIDGLDQVARGVRIDPSKIDRNEEGSRELIMVRLLELKSRKEDWVKVSDVLRPCTEKGPWSEDLQSLVTEGAVECQDLVPEMGMGSLVRIAP